MKTRSQYKQPQTDEFEFFGPHGTLLTILCLPLTVLGLYFLCDDQSCSIPVNLDDLKNKIHIQSLWNQDAFYGYIIWILFQFLLSIIVPGKTVYGHPLPIPSSQHLKIPAHQETRRPWRICFPGRSYSYPFQEKPA